MPRALIPVLLASALMLSACASRENYEAFVAEFRGTSESALVEAWGVPDRVYEADGTRYLVYENVDYRLTEGTADHYVTRTDASGRRAVTHVIPGMRPYIYKVECETTFILREGQVERWRIAGNACVM